MTTFDEVLALLPAAHTVTVEAYTGSGPHGDVYAAAVSVTCFVDQKRKLVRAPNGSQVISESTVYAALETAAPPRSRITLPDGQVTLVISAARRDGAGLPVPEHLEIACE
jgi:hypothetical protein